MSAANWNIVGLVLVLVGVIDLFVFGMPFRVRSGGGIYRVIQQRDEKAARLDVWYGILGWLGFALVLIGTLCQIAANVPAIVR